MNPRLGKTYVTGYEAIRDAANDVQNAWDGSVR